MHPGWHGPADSTTDSHNRVVDARERRARCWPWSSAAVLFRAAPAPRPMRCSRCRSGATIAPAPCSRSRQHRRQPGVTPSNPDHCKPRTTVASVDPRPGSRASNTFMNATASGSDQHTAEPASLCEADIESIRPRGISTTSSVEGPQDPPRHLGLRVPTEPPPGPPPQHHLPCKAVLSQF